MLCSGPNTERVANTAAHLFPKENELTNLTMLKDLNPVRNSTIEFPPGLDSGTAERAVDLVLEWEMLGDEAALDLVVRLYALFMER